MKSSLHIHLYTNDEMWRETNRVKETGDSVLYAFPAKQKKRIAVQVAEADVAAMHVRYVGVDGADTSNSRFIDAASANIVGCCSRTMTCKGVAHHAATIAVARPPPIAAAITAAPCLPCSSRCAPRGRTLFVSLCLSRSGLSLSRRDYRGRALLQSLRLSRSRIDRLVRLAAPVMVEQTIC